MAEIRELLVRWTYGNSPGGLTVLHTDADGDPGIAVQAVGDALTSMGPLMAGATFWQVAQQGRVFDEETGALTNQWTTPADEQGTGSGSGIPVPNSSMTLLRFETGQVVNGRFLKGRMYLPNLIAAATSGGQVIPAQATAIAGAFAPLAVPANGFRVWSRPRAASAGPPPVTARAGASAAITSVTCWSELAVLRRRR